MITQHSAPVQTPKALSMRRLRQSRRKAKTCYYCEDPPEPGTSTCDYHKFKERNKKARQRREKVA